MKVQKPTIEDFTNAQHAHTDAEGGGAVFGTSGYSGFSGLGVSGYSGFSGISGYSGKSGYSGFSGISGYSGKSGYSGYSGISGYSGYSGKSGFSGFSGYSGFSGISGYSGKSGFSGYSGISGYSGKSGFSGFSGYSGVGTSGYSGYSGNSGFSGISGSGGTASYRRTGTSAPELWYPPSNVVYVGGTSASYAKDRLYALPFIVNKQCTLDRIAVWLTSTGTTNVRLGIYNDSGNCVPGALLLDAGAVALSTGGGTMRSATISQVLTPGLYWLAGVFDAILSPADVAAVDVSTRINDVLVGLSPLGVLSTTGRNVSVGYYVAQAYGALPDPFGTPTHSNAIFPIIYVRLSA